MRTTISKLVLKSQQCIYFSGILSLESFYAEENNLQRLAMFGTPTTYFQFLNACTKIPLSF